LLRRGPKPSPTSWLTESRVWELAKQRTQQVLARLTTTEPRNEVRLPPARLTVDRPCVPTLILIPPDGSRRPLQMELAEPLARRC
jgi:hypothetical protein